MPNPPGANPLVAERAPWRSSQSCVTGGQQPIIGNPYRFLCHFFCTPGNPCATSIVTRGEGCFRYQGVSTRGVRHAPVLCHLLAKGVHLPAKSVWSYLGRHEPTFSRSSFFALSPPGDGVGTGKGTGKSIRTGLSKVPFSKLPFIVSPRFLGAVTNIQTLQKPIPSTPWELPSGGPK